MLGDCIAILARCNNSEKSLQILNVVLQKPSTVLGALPIEALKYLFNALVKAENERCFVSL